MNKLKNISIGIFVASLMLVSAYQTYALASISKALDENGISFGKAKASYSFSSGGGSLSELPDMAGGC